MMDTKYTVSESVYLGEFLNFWTETVDLNSILCIWNRVFEHLNWYCVFELHTVYVNILNWYCVFGIILLILNIFGLKLCIFWTCLYTIFKAISDWVSLPTCTGGHGTARQAGEYRHRGVRRSTLRTPYDEQALSVIHDTRDLDVSTIEPSDEEFLAAPVL